MPQHFELGGMTMLVRQRYMTITRNVMLFVNLLVILFLAIIMYKTIELICWNDLARDFLEKIRYVPMVPWQVTVFSLTLLLSFCGSILIREKIPRERQLAFYLFSIFDLLVCIAVMFLLNLSYKGILLLTIANIIIYIEGTKRKFSFIFVVIVIYILFDYDILSIKMNMFSINDFIQYYTSTERLYIFSIRNILFSLNEMAFIVFLIFTIQGQIDENTKIKELYAKLFQTAEELKVVNIQLQDYAAKSEQMAKTRERNRLAREIHDTIGHALTGITTGLEACNELIGRDIEKTKLQLMKITALAKKGLLDVRRSVSELRPDALERFSLLSALQKLTDDINECTNTRVVLTVAGNELKLNADEEATVYRVIQEGITNAVRHGRAQEIAVHLCFSGNCLDVQIRDDGNCNGPVVEGFGLKYIRERVETLAGDVSFGPEPPHGFKIGVRIPVRGRMMG